VKAAIGDALEQIKATGKAPGILNFDPAQAITLFDDGFRFIAVGSDTFTLARRSEDLLAAVVGES
jgi:4-hydroxy-2-oxoheptanedioate aldolase